MSKSVLRNTRSRAAVTILLAVLLVFLGFLSCRTGQSTEEVYKNEILALLRQNRVRTNQLISSIEKTGKTADILKWRPGKDRANIGWQLTHIAYREDQMLVETLQGQGKDKLAALDEIKAYMDLKHPGDHPPELAVIQWYLGEERRNLQIFIEGLDFSKIDANTPGERKKPLTYRDALRGLIFHEAHHHGQAHITFNLYKLSHGMMDDYNTN